MAVDAPRSSQYIPLLGGGEDAGLPPSLRNADGARSTRRRRRRPRVNQSSFKRADLDGSGAPVGHRHHRVPKPDHSARLDATRREIVERHVRIVRLQPDGVDEAEVVVLPIASVPGRAVVAARREQHGRRRMREIARARGIEAVGELFEMTGRSHVGPDVAPVVAEAGVVSEVVPGLQGERGADLALAFVVEEEGLPFVGSLWATVGRTSPNNLARPRPSRA